MIKIFDFYVLRNLFVATFLVAIILSVIILLTQSLRFLELVVDSGASASSFWVLTLLALPRFFEIILPFSLLAAVIFLYNRMTMDSELVVARSFGFSPYMMARPALILSGIVAVLLWWITMWASPTALSNMNELRQIVKAQVSSYLFKDGVFNHVSDGLTVYVRERGSGGDLNGVMIHDSREEQEVPSTIMARHGKILATEDGNQVIVYDGARQSYAPDKKVLQNLKFERYIVDMPDSGPVRHRWSEPDERTIFELLSPDLESSRDVDNLRQFNIEIHRRFIGPLLAPLYVLISCCALLLGPVDRRGQGRRIVLCIVSVVLLQGVYLSALSLARQSEWGLIMLHSIVLVPFVICLFLLGGTAERLRRRFLYSYDGGVRA